MSDDDVPVGSLLGAAYQAVVHGQSMAAREAVDLVRRIGFEQDGTAKPFRFAYQRTEATEDGPQVRTVHATVPLLSLVNPPAISIDKAAISMSLHLISQSADNGSAYTSASGDGVPAEGSMPRLKGRIVHKSDSNAVLTIESTLKQRDLLGSSRLSQLLDAAVSDRDSVWYEVLEQAEAFRTAAAAFIDAVALDGSTGNGVGVREWLQQLWQLKESVTDAVSAYRDGLLEKIPQLHRNWNTQCKTLDWIGRHDEPETMAQLRRAFTAAARHVWNALLPGKPVAEFGPPTLEQLRDRFKAAVLALTAAPPGLEGLPERLRDLEAAVVGGCIALEYHQSDDILAGCLDRYNTTATEIRKMWHPSVQSLESRTAQDGLAEAANAVWDALVRTAPEDFRVSDRRDVQGLLDKSKLLLAELEKQRRQLFPDPQDTWLLRACTDAQSGWSRSNGSWNAKKWHSEPYAKMINKAFHAFNANIKRANDTYPDANRRPAAWNTVAPAWNETARQFWGLLLNPKDHPVPGVAELKVDS